MYDWSLDSFQIGCLHRRHVYVLFVDLHNDDVALCDPWIRRFRETLAAEQSVCSERGERYPRPHLLIASLADGDMNGERDLRRAEALHAHFAALGLPYVCASPAAGGGEEAPFYSIQKVAPFSLHRLGHTILDLASPYPRVLPTLQQLEAALRPDLVARAHANVEALLSGRVPVETGEAPGEQPQPPHPSKPDCRIQ